MLRIMPRAPKAAPARPQRPNNAELLTAAQVKAKLACSDAKLKGMRDRREISYVRLGGSSGVRYWKSSIDAYLAARTIEVGDLS